MPTGVLLISGDRNWCTNVIRRRELGLLLFSRQGRCSSVFRRKEKELYCLQKKGPSAILFSGEKTGELLFSVEGKMFSTVIRRRKLVL